MENLCCRKVKSHTQDHTGSERAAPAGSPACMEGKWLWCYHTWAESWWCHIPPLWLHKVAQCPCILSALVKWKRWKEQHHGLPWCPVDETPCSQCRGPGLIPGQGTGSHMPQQKILHSTTKKSVPHATTKTQWSQINKYRYIFRADHLTCLLRNLYVGQEATARTLHGTTNWLKIGKGVGQGCLLSPCLFKFYAEYSSEMPGWMNPKLESRLLGEILTTSDAQMIPL